MDKLVGRLLDEVETLGIRDNTYVVFMGDNGTHDVDFKNPKAGQPNELKHTRHTDTGNVNGGKSHLGDAGTHVPLLVWGPDSVPQGQVCDELVDIVDLFPTFCELSGTTIPASLSIDGRSIAPQIHGRPGTPRAWVHHAFGRNKGSGENIFDGSWRLFRDSGQLWDARALPTESPVAEDDPQARAARDRLNTILEKITHDGRRPPEEFPVLEDDRLPVFQQLLREDWKEVFLDPCTEDWRERWTLDGLKATVTNSKRGMDFKAGPVRKEDASHAVMWTKDSFLGDIRLDYEYTKLDDAVEAVTILYLQATGSGTDGYDKDISKWRDKRDVAYMKTYFNHMHLHHISYAAFDVGNEDPQKDYIRARRYMPESKNGLANTNFEPDYLETGLFAKGVPHQITVIKKDDDLFMHVSNSEKELLCHWKTNALPRILGGRVGLRHMWTRAARYRNFRVSQLKEHEESRE